MHRILSTSLGVSLISAGLLASLGCQADEPDEMPPASTEQSTSEETSAPADDTVTTPAVTTETAPAVTTEPEPAVTTETTPAVTTEPEPAVTTETAPVVTTEPEPPATTEEEIAAETETGPTSLQELRDAVSQARSDDNPSAALSLLNDHPHLLSEREQGWLALTRAELVAEENRLGDAISALEQFIEEGSMPSYSTMKVAEGLFNRAQENDDTAAMRRAYLIITQAARPQDVAGRFLHRLAEAENRIAETVAQTRKNMDDGTISRHELAYLAEMSSNEESPHHDTDTAIKAYQSILKANPNHGRTSSKLMNVFISVNRLDDAIETYRSSASSPYGASKDLRNLTEALVEADRRDDALGLVAELATTAQDGRHFQRDLALVAEVYRRIEALPEAEETLRTRLKLITAEGDSEAITAATIDLAEQTAVRDPDDALGILDGYLTSTASLSEELEQNVQSARTRIENMKEQP